MGLRLFSDSTQLPPNPDPYKYEITHWYYLNGWLVITAKYPDCTPFGGQKVLVYKGFVSPRELLGITQGALDPHFLESTVSPVARFPATKEGYLLARRFVECAPVPI